jgi:hypothetical protein
MSSSSMSSGSSFAAAQREPDEIDELDMDF